MTKKIIFLIVILLGLVSFPKDVNAIEYMSCLYKKVGDETTYQLIQHKKGTFSLVRIRNDDGESVFTPVKSKISFNSFNQCPVAIYYTDSEDGLWSTIAPDTGKVYRHVSSVTCVYSSNVRIYYTNENDFIATEKIIGNHVSIDKKSLQSDYGIDTSLLSSNNFSCPTSSIIALDDYGNNSYIDKSVDSNYCVYGGSDFNIRVDINKDWVGYSKVTASMNGVSCYNVDTTDVKYSEIFNFGQCQRNGVSVKEIKTIDGKIYCKLYIDSEDTLVTGSSVQAKDKSSNYKAICGIFKHPDSGGKVFPIVKNAYKIIKIFIPVIIILLGIADFLKVLMSGEEKTMKEAFESSSKRLIMGVVFIFLPFIIELLIKLADISDNCLQYFIN